MVSRFLTVLIGIAIAVGLSGCGGKPAGGAAAGLQVSSRAFAAGAAIPRQFSCDDKGTSPPLQWGNPPPATKSFALIVDDPDANGFVHWVVYNLPATARSLPEGVPAGAAIVGGGRQGKNSFGRPGYGGPCPPTGTHRYFFRLYALDTTLSLDAEAGKEQVTAAMSGHVLAQGELMGTYQRQK